MSEDLTGRRVYERVSDDKRSWIRACGVVRGQSFHQESGTFRLLVENEGRLEGRNATDILTKPDVW